jgi:hypothetical protein
MTFEDLAPAWNSPRNAPDPAQLARDKARLVQNLDREHRGFVVHVGMVAALTLFLAGGFVQYLRSGGAFDWRIEWGAVLFLLLPIVVAALLVRGHLRHRREHPRYDMSIADAVRASIDENRLARARLRVTMIASTVAMALLPVVTWQLQLVGKQRPHEAASMLGVFGLAYVASMVWQAWRYRRVLRPEAGRLRQLLASYEG